MDNFQGAGSRWVRISLFNFVVAAAAGLALRYKLAFSFPVIDFKNLLHAHSHFAFAAWVSSCLFALLLALMVKPEEQELPRYKWLFRFSQFSSYGMLVSFLFQEYGPISIAFSTLYVFVTYGFAIALWRATKEQKHRLSVKSLRASLIFLAVSSLGPYFLAASSVLEIHDGGIFHNAVYWYLHFQYNGWFSFAVFALFLRRLEEKNEAAVNAYTLPFNLMLLACIPVYLLSVLWIVPPLWVYLLAGSAGTVQLVALYMILRQLILSRKAEQEKKRGFVETLLLFSFVSFVIKLMLQFLSVFPVLNQFVFGHRPVIIGYLHLVMLGFVTFFLFALSFRNSFLSLELKGARTGLGIFVTGVLLNESGLMLQGFSGILFLPMNWIPAMLVCAAALMLAGLFILSFSQRNFLKRIRQNN